MFDQLKPFGSVVPILLAVAVCDANAYQVSPVNDGGTVTGTIAFNGSAPTPKRFKVEKTPEVCGEADRLVEEVRVTDGKLADVVVLLSSVAAGKPFAKEEAQGGPPETAFHSQVAGGGAEFPDTTIKPKECIFGPYTGVIANGKMLSFRNQDPVKHSPHTYSSKGRVKKTLHNEDLPGDGKLDLKIELLSKIKVVKLECDQHEHMQNWFRKVENPYYTFSSVDGSFEIDQVPPGTYQLVAWHPKFKKEKKQTITVSANGKVTADFSFDPPRSRK